MWIQLLSTPSPEPPSQTATNRPRTAPNCSGAGSGRVRGGVDGGLDPHGHRQTPVDAPCFGCRVPVDTAPGPVPVYKVLKNPHSQCQSTATAGPPQFSALRTTRQLSLHTTGVQQPVLSSINCNCGSSAVSPRLHARTAGPHWECRWSNEQCGPWNLPLRHDGEENLLNLQYRDIGHRVEQLGNVHSQTNSLDHGDCLCATKEMSTTSPQFQQSGPWAPCRNSPSGPYQPRCRASWAWRRQKGK